MKTKIAICLLVISFLTINGFMLKSTEAVQSIENTVGNFTGIVLKTFANLYIKQGDKTEIRIEKEDNKSSVILTEIKNNNLIIYSNADLKIQHPVSVYITVKDITMIELSGSGSIKMNNQLKSNNLELKLSGSGNIDANVESKILKIHLSGSGNVELKGKTSETAIDISGSGNVNGKDFKTFSSTINISGSGTTTVDVEDNLVVEITGSGNVYYISDPERIQAKSRGSGRVEKIKA